MPDLAFEQAAWARGLRLVAGIDEVGRGPLAGPVVAAAVILGSDVPDGLNDSKALSASVRMKLHDRIVATAMVCVASVSARSIDETNIRAASLAAMAAALRAMPILPDHALIDGNAIPDTLPCSAEAVVKGDTLSLSIAAASIVAKVVRDRMMERADQVWPGYGFAGHKGYGVSVHRSAIGEHGGCALHRMSFAPLRLR